MTKDIKEMSEFQILSEISKIDQELDSERSEAGERPPVVRIDLMQRKTLLRHQLKLKRAKTVDGEDARLLKANYKRQAEVIRKQQEEEDRKEKKRIAEAKKSLKQDDTVKQEMAEDLTVEQLQAIIDKKKGKNV